MEPQEIVVEDIQAAAKDVPVWLEMEVFERREKVAAYCRDEEFDTAKLTSRAKFQGYIKKFNLGKWIPFGEPAEKNEDGVKVLQVELKLPDHEGKTIKMLAGRKNVARLFHQPDGFAVERKKYLYEDKKSGSIWYISLGYSDDLWPTEEQLVQIKTYTEKDQFEKEKEIVTPLLNKVLLLRDGSDVRSVSVDGIPHIE